MTRVVAVSGSLGTPSRTRALVNAIVSKVSAKARCTVEIIDIPEIAKDLGASISYDQLPESVSSAHRKLEAADLIIIGTPVYKGSYTGMLKHFFDLIDPKRLSGKVAILAATGGSDQHALVLEYQLRPLASFFGIVTVPTAIYARDTEFLEYQLSSQAISSRIEDSVNQALRLLKITELTSENAESATALLAR